MSRSDLGRCLIHWGGWEVHHPERWKNILSEWLTAWGFTVDASDDLDVFSQPSRLSRYQLIVPVWTLGELTAAQERGLAEAVAAGVGIGGFHGMCWAFCGSSVYKRVTGGQLVALQGDENMTYHVEIRDPAHPITRGLPSFTMYRTERYYMHVDARAHVLATTAFEDGGVSPVAWTHHFGRGRVFYVSVGHRPSDFAVSEAFTLLGRGMRWAGRI
ncbi:ThuA domain-containing protein [Sorangium sp. So ce1036]|uniref:ThuA domain-containing protein n=1 Tax=Sorangium sp. So ce1036 TaxID=3133328 RepID=UPI003F0DF7E0